MLTPVCLPVRMSTEAVHVRLAELEQASQIHTLWKKRDWNPPARSAVVVTSAASWPPPTSTCRGQRTLTCHSIAIVGRVWYLPSASYHHLNKRQLRMRMLTIGLIYMWCASA